MSDIKKSIIQLGEISLTDVKFVKKKPTLSRAGINVKLNDIHFQVVVQQLDKYAFLSRCTFEIFREQNDQSDFYASFQYEIVSKVSEDKHLEDLEKFAKFGAPFNAIVHVREILIGLSGRAFGRAAFIPLIDIREFGKKLIIETKQNSEQNSASKSAEPEVHH